MGPRTPPYQIAFESGELAARVERAREALRSCRLCPRECGTDRLGDRLGFCRTGRRARVSGAFAHHGEESCLSGRGGSGTIFFASCNLRCVFCQNDDISRGGGGAPAGPEDLADAMLALQERGCHNINFVTPSHVVPQILEALLLAAGKGLRLPLVYNSGGYDSLRSLELMDGIADVYMPDFKFWDPAVAERLAAARDYPEAARRAVREMHRQVGDLRMDGDGLAERGLLVRHLVLPGGLAGTREVMRFLAGLSRDTFVNIMGQYRPAGEAGAGGRHAEIGRRPFPSELEEAFALARGEGLRRFDR
jgi:putative pyruvate formate lyase activating enzyme